MLFSLGMNFVEKIKNKPMVGQLLHSANVFFINLGGLIKRRFFYFINKKYLAPNVELKNTERGRRCFVLATGPSINSQDLRQLRGELCISVSNFFVHPFFGEIKPKYHLFASTHSPISDEQVKTLFEDAERQFPDGQKILISVEDKYIVDRYNIFTKQKVYYYYRDGKKGPEDIIRDIDLTRRVPMISTIVHLGIYLAIYLGSVEVYLLGCDHDSILHLGDSRHFYKEEEHALKRAGFSEWSQEGVGSHFRVYWLMWETYRKIKNYSKRRGVEIYNSTPGGMLDVFPRRSLGEVIK